jgi:putative oxidoreductase
MKLLLALSRVTDPFWLTQRFYRFAPLPIRFVCGFGFIAHGYAKIVKNPEHFAAILHSLGVPAAHFMAWATIAIELIGGLAILCGAFVPIAAVPMLVVLLVATFTVHFQFGFTSIKLMDVVSGVPRFGPPGYETDLLYAAGLLSLVFGGAGPFAVDTLLRRWYARGSPQLRTSGEAI